MCWLYSMPNLLVIQHVEIMYLGGNNVRVVCERMWRNSSCMLSKGVSRLTRDWLTTGKSPHVWSIQGAKGSRQLEHYRKKSIVWPGSYFATQTHDSFQLQGKVVKMPYLDENWLFTFHLIPYYKYPYFHEM